MDSSQWTVSRNGQDKCSTQARRGAPVFVCPHQQHPSASTQRSAPYLLSPHSQSLWIHPVSKSWRWGAFVILLGRACESWGGHSPCFSYILCPKNETTVWPVWLIFTDLAGVSEQLATLWVKSLYTDWARHPTTLYRNFTGCRDNCFWEITSFQCKKRDSL